MAWDENGAISTSWSRNQTTRRVDSITRLVRVHTRAFLEWRGTKMGRVGRFGYFNTSTAFLEWRGAKMGRVG